MVRDPYQPEKHQQIRCLGNDLVSLGHVSPEPHPLPLCQANTEPVAKEEPTACLGRAGPSPAGYHPRACPRGEGFLPSAPSLSALGKRCQEGKPWGGGAPQGPWDGSSRRAWPLWRILIFIITLRGCVDQRDILFPDVPVSNLPLASRGRKNPMKRLLKRDKVYSLEMRNEYLLSALCLD